jgi:hypothetical protein
MRIMPEKNPSAYGSQFPRYGTDRFIPQNFRNEIFKNYGLEKIAKQITDKQLVELAKKTRL